MMIETGLPHDGPASRGSVRECGTCGHMLSPHQRKCRLVFDPGGEAGPSRERRHRMMVKTNWGPPPQGGDPHLQVKSPPEKLIVN